MRTATYDLVVIGSGPGGEKGAAQAAYFGKKVGLIERASRLGGAVANTGIPGKAMRETALYLSGLRERDLHGIRLSYDGTITVDAFMRRGRVVREALSEWVGTNLDRHHVDVHRGGASFVDAHTVQVASEDGQTLLHGQIVLIATGSRLEVGKIERFVDVGECAKLEGLTGQQGVDAPRNHNHLVVGAIERMRLSTSMPFIPGNMRSSKTRSGRDRMTSFKPSSLVSAPKAPTLNRQVSGFRDGEVKGSGGSRRLGRAPRGSPETLQPAARGFAGRVRASRPTSAMSPLRRIPGASPVAWERYPAAKQVPDIALERSTQAVNDLQLRVLGASSRRAKVPRRIAEAVLATICEWKRQAAR